MRALVVAASLFVSSAALAQQPLKPSQVRPNVRGPSAKRSPGPMLDADNAKRGDRAVGASKKDKKPEPKENEAPKDAPPERSAADQAKLDAVRARIAARRADKREAERTRAMRAQRVAKVLPSGTIPPAVQQALELHVKRMAKLDRIEALAADQGDVALLGRIEAVRDKERVRHSMWLMKLAEKREAAK
ncbi:MAG: hypothetical protein RIT81_24210 [Deltaproteobacteria bacterium]